MREETVSLLVDTLIPGGALPNGVVAPRASKTPTLARARTMLSLQDMLPLGAAIEALAVIDETSLRSVESQHGAAFARLVSAVLAAYYEEAEVLESFGWRGTPPHPGGYPLAAFEDQLLDPVRERMPFWRHQES
jgi:hypothetical protein